MADHQVENNSDGVSAETKPFGSLKNYWENMSNQRMEADCSVPSRPNVVVPTKTEKVSKHVLCALKLCINKIIFRLPFPVTRFENFLVTDVKILERIHDVAL